MNAWQNVRGYNNLLWSAPDVASKLAGLLGGTVGATPAPPSYSPWQWPAQPTIQVGNSNPMNAGLLADYLRQWGPERFKQVVGQWTGGQAKFSDQLADYAKKLTQAVRPQARGQSPTSSPTQAPTRGLFDTTGEAKSVDLGLLGLGLVPPSPTVPPWTQTNNPWGIPVPGWPYGG